MASEVIRNMKTLVPTIASTLTVLALAAVPVQAAIYTDTIGDLGAPDFTGYTHLDISSVAVQNDATSIYFTINLVGDISAVNWGKYQVGIDSVAGGDTTAPVGNPWGRTISMGPAGMDYWLGSWVDSGGGYQNWGWNGSSWVQNGGNNAVTLTSFSVSFSAPLASLGLNPGDTFKFDVYSSGGGADPATDALANPNVTVNTWGSSYASGSLVDTYTVTVPEPTMSALLGLGGLIAVRSFLRRSK
jgi:hypothetical protein